jgi:micrococcal nuclease
VEVVRVVDGDTLRVKIAGGEESLRLLCLDTEESNAGSDKPVTPWGKEASEAAKLVFPAGSTIELEFPGPEPLAEAMIRYRDNFGRLLVFAYEPDGSDFQEHWIREGYSPYFRKYGYAELPENHARYGAAERAAQAARTGVWDQLAVNGAEARNYALLGVLWELRAELVEASRRARAAQPGAILDSRLDYARIEELAAQETEATVFTELSELKRIGAQKAIITIGSMHQPFKLFMPDLLGEAGQKIAMLVENRYVGGDETHPGRSYAYVSGPLKLFNGEPELVLTDAAQIADAPPALSG